MPEKEEEEKGDVEHEGTKNEKEVDAVDSGRVKEKIYGMEIGRNIVGSQTLDKLDMLKHRPFDLPEQKLLTLQRRSSGDLEFHTDHYTSETEIPTEGNIDNGHQEVEAPTTSILSEHRIEDKKSENKRLTRTTQRWTKVK